MFNQRIIASSLIVAAGSAQALSSGCTTSVAGLAFGDLGSCLQLTSALSLLTSSGSIVSNVNTYLSSLCASGTPTCANGTLTSARSTIQSACATDIQSGGTDGAEVTALEGILEYYPQVHAAACSKNETTGDYCVVSTLYTIQNVSGSDVTISALASVLGGSGSDLVNTAASSGQLCTGCVSEIYHQALQANSTIAQTSLGSALTNQCGANFGAADASGVSVASTAATSNAASASSSASGAAGLSSSFNMAPWLLAIGTITLGAAVGGAAVL